MKRIGRRTLVRGAAGVALALPLLDVMGKRARAQTAPRRLLFSFTSNGTIMPGWRPSGGETDFVLGPILKPLEPHRKDIVILDGIDNMVKETGGHSVMGSILTGKDLAGTYAAGYDGPDISVDQVIAKRLNAGTKFPSLEVGVGRIHDACCPLQKYLVWAGPRLPIASERNPVKVFERVFTEFAAPTGDPSAVDRLRLQRKSVLDTTRDNFAELRPALASADRAKMDQHLTSIREIEMRLLAIGGSAPAAGGKACVRPPAPASTAWDNDVNYPAVGKAMMDLLVVALACDLTRVATLQWTQAGGLTRFTWLGITGAHHTISHEMDEASRGAITRINTWYAEQFAYLVAALKSRTEGAGTLLDSAVAAWVPELQDGSTHDNRRLGWTLAGKGGGAIRTGRYLRYSGGLAASQNNLLVSLMNTMGLPDQTFGKASYCSGPLANL